MWEVKSDIQICNSGPAEPFQAGEGQSQIEVGCVDLRPDEGNDPTYGNQTYVRSGSYLFSGETLEILTVARDLNGAQFLPSTAQLQIDSVNKVLCTALSSTDASNLKSGGPYKWFGHDVSNLLKQLPAQIGFGDAPGYNPTTDVVYTCTYTVTSADIYDPSTGQVQVVTTDTLNNQVGPTLEEQFAFNPGISANIGFDTGSTLAFGTTQPGTTIYSTNSLLIKNNAQGGVDLAVFIAGNNLIDSSGTALCPTSNVLSINNIGYKCKVGSYASEQWTPIPNVKQPAACGDNGALPETVHTTITSTVVSSTTTTITENVPQCLTDTGYPTFWQYSNILIPDLGAHVSDSVLHNGNQAQCYFQLKVPLPCAGTFSADNALDVLIRAV